MTLFDCHMTCHFSVTHPIFCFQEGVKKFMRSGDKVSNFVVCSHIFLSFATAEF